MHKQESHIVVDMKMLFDQSVNKLNVIFLHDHRIQGYEYSDYFR
jgi:hypothetical protein